MKVYISTIGDRSVGIFGIRTDLDLQIRIMDDEDRESIRKQLHDCFSAIYDEPAGIRFDDECELCNNRTYIDMIGCTNNNCLSFDPKALIEVFEREIVQVENKLLYVGRDTDEAVNLHAKIDDLVIKINVLMSLEQDEYGKYIVPDNLKYHGSEKRV